MPQFKDHFSTLARSYAQFRPSYPPALFEYLASLCAVKERAWDCACGSGQATLSIAQHFKYVDASDASAEQVVSAPLHPRVQYRVASAEHSELESQSVDMVTVAQSLHWFDIKAFYVEVDRVLKPGGILAVWTYNVQSLEDLALNEIVRRFYSDTVGPYWPAERRWVETGYRDLPFPFEEIATPAFEMREQWSLPHLLGYLSSWSATSRYIAANGVDPIAQLGEELEAVWDDPQLTQLIRWPLALRVSRKPQ